MKNTRDNRQTQVKNCLKWTASGLLLALLFVLVFAGTLSGAFGIENELQQNGIIENNVASAVTQNTSTHTTTVYWTDARDSSEFSITRQAQYWNVTNTPTNTNARTGTSTIGFSTTGYKNQSLQIGRAYHYIEVGDFSATSVTIKFKLKFRFNREGGHISAPTITKGASLQYSTDGVTYDWISTGDGGLDRGPSNSGDDGYGQYKYYTGWSGSGDDTIETTEMSKTINGSFVPGQKIFLQYVDSWYSSSNNRGWKSGTYGELSFLQVSFGGVTTTINLEAGDNGSIAPSGTQTFNSSTASVLSTATPNDGYHFDGWYNGTAKAFENNPQTFTGSNITAKATYTAQFGLNQLIVRYWQNIDNNDNTLLNDSSGNTFTYNTKKAFLNLPKTDDGKTFVGWSTSRSGAVVHAYDTSFEVGADKIGDTSILPAENHGATVDLYAVWVDSDFGSLSGKAKDSTWGSQGNPFVISTSQHLKNLSDIVNDKRKPVNSVTGDYYGLSISTNATSVNGVITFADCYFVIASDIGTATGNIDFVPIGKNGTYYFAGTIYGGNDSDANNRTMRTINLNIQQSGVRNVGLFGYVKGASISHLTTAGTIAGSAAVGGLVGYADGVTISNCRNNATVKATGNAATFGGMQGAYLGGFVGYATANVTVKNCYNGGKITTETSWGHSNIVGGIVGHLGTDGTVSYCYNKGTVAGSDYIGGIVGINNGTVSYCYQDGALNDLYLGTEPSNFITSNGGTITNCWILPSASQTGLNQSTIPNGKKLELFDSNNQKNANMYAPVVVDGNTYTAPTDKWESIVEKNINGFEVFVVDAAGHKSLLTKGEYLRSATASDWTTTATTTIITSNATANGIGQTKQDSTPIDVVYVYSAAVETDVFVSHSKIGKTVSNTIYNGHDQGIGDIANLPTNTGASVFYFENGNAASTATSAKKDWREGGYDVVVDIKIGDKVVGRDVFEGWIINKKTLTVEYQWTYGLYNNGSNVYNGAQQGLTSFEIKGFVANESVASGNATITLTYTNTDYTLGGSKYTLNADKSTNAGQYGVSFTLEANNYALDTNATHTFSWTISRKSITIGTSSFYYGINIEQKLTDGTVFQNLVSGHSVRVDTQKHNFYKQNIGNNQYTILQSDITVNDNSGQPVTGNYNITGGVIITVLAGDFWSDGTTNIANNPWGSQNNPYVIGTKDQLTRLSAIVGGTSAVNSIKNDTYVYVQAQSGNYSNAYFKLADNIPSVGNITPIGSNTHSFAGNFDGNNKAISGLNISVAGNNVGLFGYISGATIKYLTVNGSVKGSSNVGGVVGYAFNSTIENVTNNASVTSRYSSDKDISSNSTNGNNFIVQYDGGNVSGQGFDKLFDNQYGEKKFVGKQNSAMSFVCDFGTAIPNISGFAIYNGNDTVLYPNRRPKIVRIWGSNTGDRPTSNYNSKTSAGNTPEGKPYADQWTKVFDSSDIKLSIDNEGRHEYAFAASKCYNFRYYWVYIASVGHSAGQNANTNTVIQLAEFEFLAAGDTAGGVAGYAGGTNIVNATNNGNIVGGSNVGGIVGTVNGTVAVYNSQNNGEITGSSMVAGIIGYTDNSTIKDCINNAKVGGVDNVGGIVGKICAGSVENCINKGAVSATSQAGGIIGNTNGVTVKNCKNEAGGTVTATGNAAVGGIVGGLNDGGTLVIEKCENNAAINASNANGVAGIVGHNPSSAVSITVTSCKNTGVITGSLNVGGIGGRIETTQNERLKLVFRNCYNSAAIYAKRASQYGTVGGIIGYLYANGTTRSDVAVIEYCFSSGYVESTSGINEGGIVGNATSSTRLSVRMSYCYTTNTAHSIAGYGGATISSSYVIMNSDSSTPDTKNDARFFVYNGNKTSYAPAVIVKNGDSITSCTKYAWEDILTTNINGFMVQATVNPGASQYYHTANGTSSTVYIKPDRIENNHIANAENRNDATSFELTAWYASERNGNYYCDVKEIAISDKSTTYNGGNQGFDFGDVTPKNGSVYSISFDYVYNYNGRIETVPNEVGTYDTTVFVKIDGIVVGKKMGAKYTVDKAALNVGWEWTDKLHANLYDRTGNGDKVQFVYNGKAQGLSGVSEHLRDVQLFDVTGNDLTNTNAATYTRTYTLKDTRNYKLQNANNNNADLSGTTVIFEWKIRKNKLTVSNYWTGADLNPSGEFYTFEYNATHQGLKLQDGITFYVEPDTRGNQHVIDIIAYEIAQGVECVAADTYTRTFTIKDTTNYEVGNRLSYNTSVLPNQKGSDVNTEKSVVTYTWKIVPYSLAANINSGNVWFGGRTDLIVGNQGIANVNVGNQSYPDMRFYPLQSAQNGVQKVLVYAQYNYAADKFVLYVKYNNGTVAVLTQGTEYTVGTLDTNNTFGTFVNVVSQADPVVDTNVTASGTGNFSGNITKYYTAMFSDFGWKDGKSPSDEDWGSQDNPYVISTPEHLLRLSQIVNGGMAWNSIQNTVTAGVCIAPQTTAKATSRDYKDAYFLVTADIDMSGYISTDGVYNFLPIGTRSTQNQTELPFSATIDGGDKMITYVYNVGSFYNVDGARTNYVGLFGYLNGATISNLKVASNGGLSITDNGGIVGIGYVGGIAGYAVDSTLYNAVLAYGGWVRGENYVGGIVGYGERITIVSSEAVSSANVGGETYVGGIVGKWIVSNQNQIGGSVAGQRYVTPANQTDVMGIKYVGGIAGWMDTSSCATTISYAPQLNNNGKDGNFIVVGGIEYVGALFGALIGNGYHQNATNDKYTAIVIDKDASDKFKVGNVKVLLQNLNDKSASGNAKVVGGLVGYAEGVGILFNTDWTTSNVTIDTGGYTPSFIGGIAGVLGKNATIEAIYQLKDDGTFLTGGTHTITHSVPDAQKTFGTAAKPLGSFVGGIVGYVSSQAGVYWETGTTIFGNGISLVNSATIYATSYAGGIFGALGDIPASVASSFESDTDSILYKVLTTGVREGSASTTLGLAPTVSGNGITAQGRLVNNASISVSGSYVGGIAGYGGAKVRFVLRNTPQDSAIDVSKLNIYSGGSDIFINGSYAGGIAGYLVDNLEHDLQYIVVKARFNTNNQSATRVGGLVGYMGSGNVQNCVVTNGGSSAITASTDTYQGSEYVGGLVGETQNATIRNSVSTGFNLEKTSNTKGGLLGYGANPTIDSSWTFYIAKKRTNFAKNATPNGAYYATVSQSPYGKYILVDEGLINATESSYPTFASLCGFVGLLTNANVEGTLEFDVKVPNKTLDSNYENTQLAFYNASGNDTVTDNVDSFSKFENNNNTLTIALDMASGNSMQICVVGIEFANVAKWNSSNPLYSVTDGATKNVENSYKKPSDSDSYSADVTNNNSGTVASNPTKIYDDEGNLRYIQAIVYFNGVIVGATVENKQQVGQYDSGELTPGSSATTPYTISNQQEWNDFAYSIYSGANNYSGKYVKLLTDKIVINTGTGGQHAGTKGTHNFGATVSIPSSGTGAPNNIGYNFAGDISKDSNVNNFRGTFDGNGHYITINYVSGGYYRVSAFPNAANATFRNLTIKGSIMAASQMTGANDIANSAAYDVAGFVGKPFGSLKFYNCTNEADIIGLRNVAGLVGYNSGGQSITLEACVNTGDITSLEGSYTLGGINKKTYSYDDGWNNQGYGYGTGGIIGSYTGTLKIESCRNAGTIIGGHNVGGIIGLHNGTSNEVVTIEINNCANTGNITSNSGYWNEDEGGIEGSTSTGVRQNIFGYAGGIVGKTGQYSILKMYASYNTGKIVTLSNMSGGLAGGVGSFYFKSAGAMNAIQTGGRSEIVYCYNTGDVYAGGTFPKITSAIIDFIFGSERENIGGTISGGFVGCAGNIQISQGYNAGNIWNFGHISYDKSWQIRAAGIVGQSEPVTESNQTGYVLLDNLYNVGTLSIRPIDYKVASGHTVKNNMRYGAAISGYIDKSDRKTRVKAVDCYSINNCISSRCAVLNGKDYKYYKDGLNSWNPEYRDQWYQNSGVGGIGSTEVGLIETGRVYSTYDALTAAMDENSRLRMTGTNFAFGQSTTALSINYGNVNNYTYLLEQIIANDGSISESSVSNLSSIQWKNFPDSWLYVYGCLPQLSVFALDTQNGLSMRSVGYGKDVYDEYNENGLPAGSEQYPYIIKDGVDLMGMQALVDAGYSFEGKYIEVADGKNNLDGVASKRIKLATYDSTDTAATNDASNTMYKAVDENGNYKVGKSYHLLLQGAVFNKAYNKGENPTFVGSDYASWAWNTYYYNGGYRDNEWTDSGSNPNKFYNYGGMRQLGIFALQNFIPMGRGSSVFKGHFSGKQANGENTTIDDVRITTGKYGTTTEYGSEYGGLFAKVQDAYIGYISIGGSSKIWSFTKENDISACGGIVGLALGDTVIDNCGIKDTAEIGAYGVSKTNEYVILDNGKIVGNITNGNFAKDTYAGGIAGMADPKQGNTYNAGITTTIRNCSISTSGRIESAKSNIGGVLGYVEGGEGALGKGNSVRIEGCEVQKAAIQAANSAKTSSHIGGVLGYGSEFVAAFITGCEVGNGADTVTIKGEHSLGGIAGGMSNAKGGYIDSCTVGANTTIERIDVGGDKTVLESPKHGTAIGGLVGFTQNSNDDTSPLTTTFSGTSAFNGTITVSVEATNPSSDSDGKISCIGGIVGDMGSGANFASGSNVTVGGNINITLAAANVGGVAGRTNKATFIGKFNVAPNMSTENAENVGGFIGKNIGTVYILADTTDKLENTTIGALNGTSISIGGKIKGTSEVGGFIGVNDSGSTLNIGSNVANAKPYKSGTLTITITASVTGSGDNVGGIVGKNEGDDENTQDNDYATIDIVKGTIEQNGAIKGANNVGGIIGLNDGLLTTGGGEADTTIGGVTLSEEQQNKIKNLSINNTGSVTGTGDYVGGVVGKLDSPSALRTEDSGKGAIAGTFTNSGTVEGNSFVGGSLGFVGKNVTITAKNNVATLFVNDGEVTAHGYFAGGSIGALVGKIQGESSAVAVKFENKKKVNATGFVGGSIGVLAGPVSYAQFVNSSGDLEIAAVNSVGGSVGYIGVPSPLSDELVGFTAHQIDINNTHFEASGELKANPTEDAINAAKKDKDDNGWGGVGGAIGVMGAKINSWSDNTYYANGNVKANGIYNVGGIVGLISANNITISNMLAYRTTVTGGKNVGGIVGATTGDKTVINSAYAIEGTFSATAATKGASDNVGGIIGLAKTDTDASTSYWVKGYANSDIATYDVKDLSKLGFTTGKATTGWFFLYANDADGANGLGTINTSHSTNSDLQYWKRIADAYTASEREKGLDKTDLKSNIVYGGGSPQLSTLYATATAAEVNSQYYMYTATSNEAVKPQVEFDDTRNGYFISVKTNDQDAAGNKRQAQNIAVFYRKITKGSDLTYNGYARNAVVGMDGVGLLEQTPDETTVYDETYRNKYFYTTSTSVDGTTATTAMSDPNTYKSTIKIYFFDGKGKARIVGGIDDLEWTIKARELSATFKVATNRKYGEDSNGSEGENKYDMFVSISNIAPNRGKQVPIKLDVSVGNDIVVTFTWDGTVFKPSKAGSGITLSSIGMIPSEAMKDSDTMFIAEEQTDGLNTQVLNCYLVFTEAKAYTVTINTSDVVAKPRYTIKNEEATGNFTVSPAELRLERTSGGSHAFDNTSTHGAVWKITGFVYEDGFKQLAQFNPVFHSNGQTENMYDSGGLKNNINFTNGSVVQATQTDGVNKTITITLSTVRTLGDYYIEFNAGKVGENKYRVGNYELSFADGQNEYHIVKTTINISSNLTSANNKKVYNQKTSVITVTFTASAAGDPSFSGISNFEEFLTRFFAVKDTAKFSKVDIPTSSNDVKKTVTWTFTTEADAGSYVIELIEGKDHVAEEANCAHVPDKLPTYTYTINRRPITLSATKTPLPTGKTNYVYNTKHQGIDEVFVNQGSQSNEIGLLSGDRIIISVRINGSTESTLTFQDKYSKAAGVSTINANTYTASFSLSGNNNYTLSPSSLSWTIEQYVVKVGAFSLGSDKTYDGTAVTPTITIVGISGSNGTYTYENDTFTLTYSIEKDGGSAYESGKLVNAGTYRIKVGGTNGKIVAKRAKGAHDLNSDTSASYKFDSTNSTTEYKIDPCPISIEWNYPSLVYNGKNQTLTIKSISVHGVSSPITMTSNTVRSGLGNDTLTFTLSEGGINAGEGYITKATLSGVSGTNEGVISAVTNYTPETFISDNFAIAKSKLKIVYSSGIANKVYDATTTIKGNTFAFTVSSTNGGANGKVDMFTITKAYDNKNVSNGYTKTVNFKYSFTSADKNYEFDTTAQTEQSISNVGQITPAHIKVALDKLRSGKATRTFTNDEWYGGQAGASGGEKDGKSTVYRSGEGFRISGVFGNDDIKVVAKYAETGDDRAMFDKYVNDIVKIDEKTFAKAAAGTHLKMLVFEMTGGDAKNYTFNVYNNNGTDGKKYSEKDSTAGDKQTVTVYDTSDKANGHQNASGAEQIKIEITVKTYKVEYTNTAQSYANADNTYNTNWERVGVSNNPPGVTVTVSNGWMYADGQDHGDDEQAEKKVYKAYTTIRGSQNSVRLGAKISGIDGMELNYKMVNQPILTIGYFVVDNNDVFEIGSASSLMIASYYWWVAQNGQNPDFNLPLVATSTWHKIVSNDDYMTKPFEKPSDAPSDVDMTGWDWDMYFAWFEQQYNVKIFLNETGISNEDGTWGYYTTDEESQQKQYTKYRMVRDFSGKLSESDIAILEAFFPKDKGWGVGKTYLDNFLNTSVGSVLTAVGSVFRWYNGSVGQFEFDGNGYVIEYLNIMGYDKENVGLFDIIGANGIVKNLHLRNITINANKGNVGGIAGSIAAAEGDVTNVTNVSFHGKITASGGTVGGLFGTSARAIDGAIVLGEISATNANVGGVVGTATADLTKVVSMMQITASGGTVGAFTSDNAHVGENCTHMTNAVWKKGTSGTGFVNVDGKNVGYNALMSGSNSLYANAASALDPTYDVISETFADSGQNVNPRQSKRLRDMVSVYLLMYSLSANGGTYTISSSSWLVGTADGTTAKPIAIANKQNVSLLRELRFASFTLKANVSIDIASTFSGAFYGSVNAGAYKITCDKAMFEAYSNDASAWLSVQQS